MRLRVAAVDPTTSYTVRVDDRLPVTFEVSADREREVYPATLLLLTTSPMLKHEPLPSGPGPVDELARTRLEHVVARRTSEGDRFIELVPVPNDASHWGCGGHPDTAMDARIAERLGALIRSRLHR